MPTKKELIHNLKHETYCRLMPSKLHGIGTFAIKTIPKNTTLFVHSGKNKCGYNSKTYKLTKEEVNKLPKESAKLIKDFFGKENDNSYYVPKNGINSLDISYYMNHSNKPNVRIVYDECEWSTFKTNKIIKKNEELLICYDDF